MALDESKERDTQVAEEGITFLFGPKSATLVGDLVIDWDDERGFTIYDEALGQGPDDCEG